MNKGIKALNNVIVYVKGINACSKTTGFDETAFTFVYLVFVFLMSPLDKVRLPSNVLSDGAAGILTLTEALGIRKTSKQKLGVSVRERYITYPHPRTFRYSELVTPTMRLHPHTKWATAAEHFPPKPAAAAATIPSSKKNPPKEMAKRFYLHANRLYARTSSLCIWVKDLLAQTQLNDREVQLQDYFSAERETRGNGSPLEGNPQQVFTFSATSEVPINTVTDDWFLTGVAEEEDDDDDDKERELGGGMLMRDEESVMERAYRRILDRSSRGKVVMRSFMSLKPSSSWDLPTVMRMERSVSAQGF